MEDTLKFLGHTLHLTREYLDQTAATPKPVKVYAAQLTFPSPSNLLVENRYIIRVNKTKNTDSDFYYSIFLTGPGFTRSFVGFLLPMQERLVREYMHELLTEQIAKSIF